MLIEAILYKIEREVLMNCVEDTNFKTFSELWKWVSSTIDTRSALECWMKTTKEVFSLGKDSEEVISIDFFEVRLSEEYCKTL